MAWLPELAQGHRARRLILALLLALAGWQLFDAVWIHAKAQLAQYLIRDAWLEAHREGYPVKPWGWADMWPVARLQMPEQQVDLYVLDGAHGSALAFGPGYVHGSAIPGDLSNAWKTSIVSGHRDTHFRFLRDIELADELFVTASNTETLTYEVTNIEIVNSLTEPLQVDQQQAQLILVTCYPFDAVQAGGPMRYVVTAKPKPPQPIAGVQHNDDRNSDTL